MGQPYIPNNAKYFTSVLSTNPSFFDEVRTLLEENLGEIEEVGRRHPWDFSPAYARELGTGIQRCFFVFRDLSAPENLPDFKLVTNNLERRFFIDNGVERQRKVNIDPGYLNGSQVIVASTKRYANRVYLRDGIYADLTLYYNGRTYCPITKLTLPDYSTRATIRFFNHIRRRYIKESRQQRIGDFEISDSYAFNFAQERFRRNDNRRRCRGLTGYEQPIELPQLKHL